MPRFGRRQMTVVVTVLAAALLLAVALVAQREPRQQLSLDGGSSQTTDSVPDDTTTSTLAPESTTTTTASSGAADLTSDTSGPGVTTDDRPESTTTTAAPVVERISFEPAVLGPYTPLHVFMRHSKCRRGDSVTVRMFAVGGLEDGASAANNRAFVGESGAWEVVRIPLFIGLSPNVWYARDASHLRIEAECVPKDEPSTQVPSWPVPLVPLEGVPGHPKLTATMVDNAITITGTGCDTWARLSSSREPFERPTYGSDLYLGTSAADPVKTVDGSWEVTMMGDGYDRWYTATCALADSDDLRNTGIWVYEPVFQPG